VVQGLGWTKYDELAVQGLGWTGYDEQVRQGLRNVDVRNHARGSD
jgi:hypothetical protein